MSPVQKYLGEQHERYGGRLQWPGAHGFPFLGDAPPSLKQHEVEALPTCGRAYEKVFDLNDPADAEYYNWVRDRIRNGLFVQDFKRERWPDDKQCPTIYLEWTQCFTAMPQKTSTGGSIQNTNAKQFTLRRPT
jgi:hypothetical protein